MIQQVYMPSRPLRSVLLRYEFITFSADHPSDLEFFYPPCFDNGFLFIFYNNLPVLVKNDLLDYAPIPTTHFAPTLRTPSYNLGFNDLSAIRVTFLPGAVASLYQVSMHAFPNVILELGKTSDKELAFLYEKLAEIPTSSEQVAELEKYFLGKLVKTEKLDNRLFTGLNNHLDQNGYTSSVKKLAKSLGYSIRSFNRHLNVKLGVSASEFIRIHRFGKILKYMEQYPDLSLTEIAYRVNYYDQAHFIRDFKRMIHRTPGQYLKHIKKKPLMLSSPIEGYPGA